MHHGRLSDGSYAKPESSDGSYAKSGTDFCHTGVYASHCTLDVQWYMLLHPLKPMGPRW